MARRHGIAFCSLPPGPEPNATAPASRPSERQALRASRRAIASSSAWASSRTQGAFLDPAGHHPSSGPPGGVDASTRVVDRAVHRQAHCMASLPKDRSMQPCVDFAAGRQVAAPSSDSWFSAHGSCREGAYPKGRLPPPGGTRRTLPHDLYVDAWMRTFLASGSEASLVGGPWREGPSVNATWRSLGGRW